jgi:hypothetical protein
LDHDAIRAGLRHLLGLVGLGLELGRGAFGQVAAVADLPFVVGFDQDGAGQAQQRGQVGEDVR